MWFRIVRIGIFCNEGEIEMIVYIDNRKRHIHDVILYVYFLLISVPLMVAMKFEITTLRIIQFALVFWLMILFTRIYHLMQYMATVDVDLTEYIDTRNNQLPFKYKEWKKYLKQSDKKYLKLIVVAQLMLIICTIIFHIPINTFKDLFLSLLFIYITIYGLTIATIIIDFIDNFIIKYKGKSQPDPNESYGKKKMIRDISQGVIFGIIYAIGIAYLFTLPLFHYLLHFFAFSILFSFSKILLALYRYFSSAVYQVVGVRFEQITLIFEK